MVQGKLLKADLHGAIVTGILFVFFYKITEVPVDTPVFQVVVFKLLSVSLTPELCS